MPQEKKSDAAFDYFEMKKHNMLGKTIVTKKVVTKDHSPFFKRNKISGDDILEQVTYDMKPNKEVFVSKVFASHREQNLSVYATKQGRYCFLKMKGPNKFQRRFYCRCSDIIQGKCFWRNLNKDCLYPPVNPPRPPVLRACYL